MKTIKAYFSFLLLSILSIKSFAQVKEIKVQSPDAKITAIFSVVKNQLSYQVLFKSKEVVQPSKLGLKVDELFLAEARDLKLIAKKTINESYPTRGTHSKAIYKATVADIAVNSATPLNNFAIEVQVFNDGVAFRYHDDEKAEHTITDDLTEFTIPAGSIVWSQNNIKSYEANYQKQEISEVLNGQKVGPPLTIQLPNNLGYAAITEAGLTDFAGMSLVAKGNRVYKAFLTGPTHKKGKFETSWRLIEIATDLNGLVNSDMISNLSAKPNQNLFPKGFDTEWIKPGMSVWSWLADNGTVTFENMKKFSDWAGELNIPYNLVDEGWDKWNDDGKTKWELMKELVDYSAKKNVKIWLWKAYPDRRGVAGLKQEAQRKEFFRKCKEAGIVGLKIDFFDQESQEMIDFYQVALKEAAEMQLMLDFHGANKPTGESATWPNEMTREAVRGLEVKASLPAQVTTIPFTRLLAGHADYTPFSFRDVFKETTLVHQLATVATFNSPFMCLAVNPEELIKHPLKELLVNIPTVWDETIILPQSKIGELVLTAKRKDKTWYLLALNGTNQQKLNIELSFLPKGEFTSTTVDDELEKPEKILISKSVVNGKTKLKLNLIAGGGYFARITTK